MVRAPAVLTMATHSPRNYYRVLGIDRSADAAAIKRAYHSLVQRYHPDLHPEDEDAETRLRAINEAYAVLIDPDQRRAYEARIYPSATGEESPPQPMAASPPRSYGICLHLDIGHLGISIQLNDRRAGVDIHQILRELARDLE